MLQMNPDKLFCTKRRLLAFCHFGKVRVIQPTVEQCLRLFDDLTEQNLFGFIEREDLSFKNCITASLHSKEITTRFGAELPVACSL